MPLTTTLRRFGDKPLFALLALSWIFCAIALGETWFNLQNGAIELQPVFASLFRSGPFLDGAALKLAGMSLVTTLVLWRWRASHLEGYVMAAIFGVMTAFDAVFDLHTLLQIVAH